MDYVSNKERNQEIYNMRENGSTYKVIAQQYGISIERARQICLFVKNQNKDELASDLYKLIVDEKNHTFTVGLFNSLKRAGINTISDLKDNINDINENPEGYIYIGAKSRAYLNQKLESLTN